MILFSEGNKTYECMSISGRNTYLIYHPHIVCCCFGSWLLWNSTFEQSMIVTRTVRKLPFLNSNRPQYYQCKWADIIVIFQNIYRIVLSGNVVWLNWTLMCVLLLLLLLFLNVLKWPILCCKLSTSWLSVCLSSELSLDSDCYTFLL